jgi:hypothetical protein
MNLAIIAGEQKKATGSHSSDAKGMSVWVVNLLVVIIILRVAYGISKTKSQ